MSQGKIQLDSKRTLYVQARGLKTSSKGRVTPAGDVLSPMSKSERRLVRKALHSMGRRDLVRASFRPAGTS